MANPEHLEILKQGVEAWNEWRDLYHKLIPDLSNADLRGSYLVNDTEDEQDSLANVVGANFRGANLSGANLSDSYLRGADFSGADLSRVDLSRADLTDVDFTYVTLGNTSFGYNDLSQIKGLETVHHHNSSAISISTIHRSQGKIPKVFLRGCQVPEDFITYMRSLTTVQPIQFYSCFISYSSKDNSFAELLYVDLQNKGVRCWFAPEDLKIGDKFRDRIDESIRLHDKLLIVLSENSVTSPWVSDEVEAAIEREHREGRTVLYPIKIDDAVMESRQACVFRNNVSTDFATMSGEYESPHDELFRVT